MNKLASEPLENKPNRLQQINELSEMEGNLQLAINDLIDESDHSPGIDVQHVSMIISHLAMAAATLREKKQTEQKRLLWE